MKTSKSLALLAAFVFVAAGAYEYGLKMGEAKDYGAWLPVHDSAVVEACREVARNQIRRANRDLADEIARGLRWEIESDVRAAVAQEFSMHRHRESR